MASLFNTRISDTYQGLIKSIDNAALTATLKQLTDGTGAATGVYMNTAGDFKVNAILEFGSLKDTGENIIITKFVDEADGIANNDNDTTIPTTAAIVDYVAAQITIEDLDFTGDTGSGQIDLDSQIFAIGGTVNEITTVASGQSLTLSLDSTGVYLPNNSTATTQTAGDNSTKLATTSYVDTLDAASDLDFSGDSGTGDINLNTEVLAVTGTANQIETTASGVGLSLSFPAAGITLPNGSVATTQTAGNNSTKVATTAYVDVLDAASDLDITGDTGTGDVNLNTQTLNIIGTPNEVTTAVVNQTATISLPSSISVDLVGNVTGNLTGNVTGNLTGNSAGTHTGAVVGNVTGNVIGNVTGALTGNADTSTAWQTARDLSVTGEATGIISNIDGTSNESGAITLDNNSVTGKVLTGLPTPSASSVLATDSIVEGIGKLQSQINGLAGGLRFMGSWDATANSPVLGSGGGEAAAGTTTSAAANKLIQTGQTFLSTVSVGDQVVNQVDGQSALVTNVDSNTILSLDADIMLSGESYTIDNSPFLTQGNYYVVSVGGTTSLNGINQWTIADWVIAGANNEWTKLDHSQVDGTGTTGNLTKWSSTSVIADSIVSESGTALTVTGSLNTTLGLTSTGDFAVNTNKFTVLATTGNTAIAGSLIVNGLGIFNSDGNGVGLRINGRPSDDIGEMNMYENDGITLIGNIQTRPTYMAIGSVASTPLYLKTVGTTALTIDTSQNSTFVGTVTAPTFLGDLNGTINTLTTAVTQAAGNNSTKVATTAYVDTSAGLYLPLAGGTMTGNTIHNDNVKSIYGTASDGLEIFHDGSNSHIKDTGTGVLFVETDYFRLVNPSAAQSMISANTGGSVILYNAGGEKLATTSTGVSVTGNGTFSGNVNVDTNANAILTLDGSSGSTEGIIIKHSGTEVSRISHSNSTSLVFSTGSSVTTALTLDASQNATFSGGTIIKGNGIVYLGYTDASAIGGNKLEVNGNIYGSGNATFAGNVGIGITPNSSYSKLQVKAPASSYGFDLIGRDAGSNGESQITFWNSNQTTQLAAIFNTADNLGFVTGTTERMRITSGGTILFGKADYTSLDTVGFRFDGDEGGGGVIGRCFASIINTQSTYYLRDTTNLVYRFYVTGAGQIHATSTSITAISDITLKENIKPLETGLDEVMKLQPRRFDWKNGDGKNIAGFVAQEVEEILPDLVSDYKYNDEETKKSLKMGDMIPTLVKAIQELKAEVDKLKQECNCK
jgi:trimeric autotransporter adhesin